MGNLVERAAGERGTGANLKLHIGGKLTKAVLGKIIAPAFQLQSHSVFVIRPAVTPAAGAIDRLTPGRIREAVFGDYKVSNVVIEVQHNIFARVGGKRVVTIRIRAGLVAVIGSAVDALKFVKAAAVL